jgi:hypothetical protein
MSSHKAFDEFFDAYIEAALWSTNDASDESGGEPLDKNYDASDIDKHSHNELKREARRFFDDNIDDIQAGPFSGKRRHGGNAYAAAGHDFWLTRNGHGVGFWDGDWPEPEATRLTDASKEYGEVNLYVGDDGKIYASGYEPPVPRQKTEQERLIDFFFPKRPGSHLMSLKSWRRS